MVTKKIPVDLKIKAVESYLSEKKSMRIQAKNLGVHYNTLWRWVKLYRQKGGENFRKWIYQRGSWNRTAEEIEQRVMLLKEKEPHLTLKKSQQILRKDEIEISLKGIWGVWKRYGLTTQFKDNPNALFFGPKTPEVKEALEMAKIHVQQGKVKQAARILNLLPSCPDDSILEKIPLRFLSDRRKIQYFSHQFGKIPFNSYYHQICSLRKRLENKGLNYSSLLAAFWELLTMYWMGYPEKRLKLLNHIENRVKTIRNPSIRFLLTLQMGMVNAELLHYGKARKYATECKRLTSNLPYAYYLKDTGDLLTYIGEFKDAVLYYQKALDLVTDDKEGQRLIVLSLSLCLAQQGKYKKALKLLPKLEKENIRTRPQNALIRAYCVFTQGRIHYASMLCEKTLNWIKQDKLGGLLSGALLAQACIFSALGRKKDAKGLISRYLPLLKKHHMYKDASIFSLSIHKPLKVSTFPRLMLFQLIWKAQKTLSPKDYDRVMKFTKKRGLQGIFHRTIVFFPDIIQNLLERGVKTKLPIPLLRLPVFNTEMPVYHIKFLGNLIVYKNQKYLKVIFRPKDVSFLVQLALKAGKPNKTIPLDKIYYNFWRNSVNPSRNLAHLLVRIKKAIKLPSHLLEISYKKDNPVLINRGIHFVTDYDEYRQILAQAKALERAGEWGFAKREYLSAFKLFRGEPFKKMYDDWSDDKRLEILFGYETEVHSFAKKLKKRGRKEEAEKLLKRAERIVPLMEE